MLVESLETLLGNVPVQFEPVLWFIAAFLFVMLLAYFAEFLVHLILRW